MKKSFVTQFKAVMSGYPEIALLILMVGLAVGAVMGAAS